MTTPNEIRKAAFVETEKDRKAAFERWLDDPLVRLVMSTIGQANPPEALVALLEGAFNAGFGVGVEVGVAQIITTVMRAQTQVEKEK